MCLFIYSYRESLFETLFCNRSRLAQPVCFVQFHIRSLRLYPQKVQLLRNVPFAKTLRACVFASEWHFVLLPRPGLFLTGFTWTAFVIWYLRCLCPFGRLCRLRAFALIESITAVRPRLCRTTVVRKQPPGKMLAIPGKNRAHVLPTAPPPAIFRRVAK